ncbi:hypothetical protein BC835DRAFT_1381976 [Cytidiella melzeri]|nr:hypothetical protein BC835DRAFT_1381976 [Cytidiella melzeri]
MKERYEQVTTTHEQYKQELAVANEKIRNLQNECNLLLDAVDIAVPGQPTLMHYLQHDPVPLHYTAQNAPIVPEMVPAQPSPVEESEPGRLHATQQLNGTNGHQ